jgi:hypothetical protein
MSILKGKLSRRNLLKTAAGASAAIAAPAIFTKGAFAADKISVADVGGGPWRCNQDGVLRAFRETDGHSGRRRRAGS